MYRFRWGIRRAASQETETWYDKQERLFIEAIKTLKNFEVTDGGGVSIDPEELREKVLKSRAQNSQFVGSTRG